jgi:hypothetical protein
MPAGLLVKEIASRLGAQSFCNIYFHRIVTIERAQKTW